VADDQLTTPTVESPRGAEAARSRFVRPRVWLLGGVLGLALAAGIVVWAVTGNGGGSDGTSGPVAATIRPVALSAAGLRTLARVVGQPIYWAGPRKGYLYELRRTSNGNVYVRYLPPGVNAGARGAKYLVVGTYPFRGAYEALRRVTDAEVVQIPGGGIGTIAPNYRKSVHLAFPRVDYQMEVFDPSPARALHMATSGQIRPVR
jgi:hypothetical protein